MRRSSMISHELHAMRLPCCSFSDNIFVMVQIVRIVNESGHVRIHTPTPREATLHHPSTHSDSDTDPKHIKSRQFRAHLDQSPNFWFLLDLKTLESDVSSGKTEGAIAKRPWLAKQQCLSTCCGSQTRRPVATLCPRY